MYLSLVFSHVLDPYTHTKCRGDEYLADIVEVLMALSFENRLSGPAASWAVAEFGPSSVSDGFFKFSQLVVNNNRESYFLAPLVLAAHLLASKDTHNSMLDEHRVMPFCINLYWNTVRKHHTIGGLPAPKYSSMIADFIYA